MFLEISRTRLLSRNKMDAAERGCVCGVSSFPIYRYARVVSPAQRSTALCHTVVQPRYVFHLCSSRPFIHHASLLERDYRGSATYRLNFISWTRLPIASAISARRARPFPVIYDMNNISSNLGTNVGFELRHS